MSTSPSSTSERLQQESAELNADGQAEFDSATLSGETSFRGRADAVLQQFGARFSDVESMVEDARAVAGRATDYVREKPLQALGVAVAVGVVAGLLAGRSR